MPQQQLVVSDNPFAPSFQDYALPESNSDRALAAAVERLRRPGVQVQGVFWPGVTRVESFSYTCLHGISPGVWRITTAPQTAYDQIPETFGNLVMTDGQRTVVVRGCKADRIDATRTSAEGTTYNITGFDRRWLWRNQYGGFGAVGGRYNRTDTRGKLIPWSIRSPEELFRICLDALGEVNYVLDVPEGIPRAAGANLDRYLRLGEYFRQSKSNPYVVWDVTPPADALAMLADLFACRVVYQPYTDRVLIVPQGKPFNSRTPKGPSFGVGGVGLPAGPPRAPGVAGFAGDVFDPAPPVTVYGADGPPPPFPGGNALAGTGGVRQPTGLGGWMVVSDNPFAPSFGGAVQSSDQDAGGLPDYPYDMISPGIDDPESPRSVGVAGPPIRVQLRLALEAVGEEWDGSYLPIDQLSYAPRAAPGRPQITRVQFSGPDATRTQGVQVFVTWPDGSTIWTSSSVPMSAAARAGDLAAQVPGDPAAAKAFAVTTGGNDLVIQGNTNDAFDVTATTLGVDTGIPTGTAWKVTTTQDASQGGRGWGACPPPYFMAVQPTDRLSRYEARALARKSVFRTYRVTNLDPSDRTQPLQVPAYGKLRRVQQLVVQPSKAEQVVPQPRIAVGVNKGDPAQVQDPTAIPGSGVLPEFYNGVSRDRNHTVTGSVSRFLGQVYWFPPPAGTKADDLNTGPCDRVFVDSEVTTSDRGDQLVTFADYVYRRARHGTDDVSPTTVEEPALTLETAALVCDPDADLPVRWSRTRSLPGGVAPTEWHVHEDLQVSVIGEYTDCDGVPGGPTTNVPPPPPPPPPQRTGLKYTGDTSGNVNNISLTLTVDGNTGTYTTTGTGDLASKYAQLTTLLNAWSGFTLLFNQPTVSDGGSTFYLTALDPATTFTVQATTVPDPLAPPDPNPWGTFTYPSVRQGAGGPGPKVNPKNRPPNRLTGWHYGQGDLEHVDRAAADYLEGHARKYVPVRTEGRRYIGVWPVNPDGAVQQVVYQMGPEGPSTLASLNDEQSTLVPTYPQRRRGELTAPNRSAVVANMAERAMVNRLFPLPGGAVK